MPKSLYVHTKRFADVACAGTMAVLLLPVLLVIAGLVRWRMGPPVLFRQRRPGIHERPFELLKFRTMVDVRGSGGEPLPDEQRLTFLGSLLRRSSLDELPTLINVIRGDMSLVGPRPLLLRYLPYFTERERLRFSVSPGMTGWAQICGRNHTPWRQRLEQDVWYVEHQGPWLDTKILLRTALQVLLARGVVVDARSVMLNLDEERGLSDNGRVEVDDND
jgi:lipopolysaccharide/colanic/teichoic acid biosynthesis glycosyltransferase